MLQSPRTAPAVGLSPQQRVQFYSNCLCFRVSCHVFLIVSKIIYLLLTHLFLCFFQCASFSSRQESIKDLLKTLRKTIMTAWCVVLVMLFALCKDSSGKILPVTNVKVHAGIIQHSLTHCSKMLKIAFLISLFLYVCSAQSWFWIHWENNYALSQQGANGPVWICPKWTGAAYWSGKKGFLRAKERETHITKEHIQHTLEPRVVSSLEFLIIFTSSNRDLSHHHQPRRTMPLETSFFSNRSSLGTPSVYILPT